MKTIRRTLLFVCLVWTTAWPSIVDAQKSGTSSRRAVLLVGGDVQWSLLVRPPSVLFGQAETNDPDWRASPTLNGHDGRTIEMAENPKAAQGHTMIRYHLNSSSVDYPLKQLAPVFHAADLVFLNLETPLSDTARLDGLSRTPTAFASALRAAGVDIVNLANNHTFDAEEQGFLDTIHSLAAAGVQAVGGGTDLDAATRPVIVERHGIRIGFLGYAQFSNMGEPAFAAPSRAGIAPMDLTLMKRNIAELRKKADFVAVSIHWGTDKSANVSPANRKLAHELIDAGADMILGSHTPFPKGIEVYRGKAIIYSPSHVALGHNYADWGDNVLVRITLTPDSIDRMEVLPIAGTGVQLAQPYLLRGKAAATLLDTVRDRSAVLDTSMQITASEGIIQISGKP